MNLALIGYGKMGKEIERVAIERGDRVTVRVDIDTPPPTAGQVENADVAIHFAHPDSVLSHVQQWAGWKKNLVIGTTAWQRDVDKVRSAVESAGIGLVHASNFSIGVNAMRYLVREAGRLFNRLPEYDVFIHEAHHRDKLDSPSGTALTLADILIDTIERKKSILTQPPPGKIDPEQLHVSSSRAGSIVGTHGVVFDSRADQIEIVHTAKNREGFAVGALMAAHWIQGKRGMFTMDDVLADLLQER
jgi:4-hydroxy-tetrahydrodipicolinate reductase